MESGGSRFGKLLLAPITLLYLGVLLAPISFFLLMSVFKYSAFDLYIPTVTGANFWRLISDPYYQDILLRTLKIAALTAVISLLLGYPLAYFLARHTSRWRGVLIFLVIAPLMTGVIVRSYGWIVLLGSNGTVNKVLLFLHVTDHPIKILYTQWAVLIGIVHILMPYMVFPIFSALASQDPNLEKAANTLGASHSRAFFEVTLPLSRSGIYMGTALVFTLTAGAVVTPALLGGREVTMLGQTIYQLVLSTLNWPLASAAAMILVLCQFCLILLYFRGGRRRGA